MLRIAAPGLNKAKYSSEELLDGMCWIWSLWNNKRIHLFVSLVSHLFKDLLTANLYNRITDFIVGQIKHGSEMVITF